MDGHGASGSSGTFPGFGQSAFQSTSQGGGAAPSFGQGPQQQPSQIAGPSRGRGAHAGQRGGRGRGGSSTMMATFDGSSRGARGGRGGAGPSASRGRGGTSAGNAPAARGGRAAFANRSVVFNKPPAAEESQAEDQPGSQDASEYGGYAYDEQDQDDFAGQEDPMAGTFSSSSFQQSEAGPLPPAQTSNALGGSADSDAERKRRFENLPKQNRFFEMRAEREALRARYISEGVLPDPDKPQDLAAAKTFRGTCLDMCPEFEREEREFQNEGDPLEMFPGTTRLDPELAVKIYRRPAAGRELPLPEDVRPPEVLRQTLDYLLHDLLPSDPSTSRFTAVQPFMWNRTRAIRQDFIVQGERGPLAIECHERIARYHILCLHWRGGVGADGWSEQQELEQLRKTIRSLTEFYEDIRRTKGKISANEAEFRAYNLLLHLSDPETLREVEALPSVISDAAPVRAALTLRMYAQRSNNAVRRGRPANTEATLNLWTRFFGELRKTNNDISYLLACLAENSFSQVRAGALKAMGKAYQTSRKPLPLGFLRRSLGMDSDDEVLTFATVLGWEEVHIEGSGEKSLGLRLIKTNDDVPLPIAPFSKSIVERKRGTWSAQDVVDGKASGAVQLLPIVRASRSTAIPRVEPAKAAQPSLPPIAQAVPSDEPPQDVQPLQVKPEKRPQSLPASSPALSAKAPSFTPGGFSPALPATPSLPPAPKPTTAFSRPSGFPSLTSSSNIPQQTNLSAFQADQSSALSTAAPLAKQPEIPAPAPQAVKPPPMPQGFFFADAKPSKQASAAPATLSTPTPAPATQDTRIEQPRAHEIVKPQPAPIPSAPEETKQLGSSDQSARRRARTKGSVTAGLYSHLLSEFLKQKTLAVAEQAFLRETRIRHNKERATFLHDSALRMSEEMFTSYLEDAVASLAGQSIADELLARHVRAKHFTHWKSRLETAKEQRRQTERLKRIRQTLAEHDIAIKTAHGHRMKRVGAGRPTVEGGDSSLVSKLRQAREHTESLWLPSTFLLAIAVRIEELAIPGLDTITIGVKTGDAGASSGQWLLSKFSLQEEHVAEVETRDGTLVRAVDLAQCTTEDLEQERELGLVVFELKRSQGEECASYWASENLRLQEIARSNIVKCSRFSPSLLIISWRSMREVPQVVEEHRRIALQRLHLTAHDKTRLAWDSIGVWYPDQGTFHGTPQTMFEAHMHGLLTTLEPNRHLQLVSFDSLASTVAAPFVALLERVGASTSKLLGLDRRTDADIKDFARETFAAMSRLLLRVIEDIASLSVIENDGALRASETLRTNSSVVTAHSSSFMVQSALTQLQRVRQAMRDHGISDSDVALTSTWLTLHNGQDVDTFPWQEYFTRLLQALLIPLRDAWLECLLPTIEDVKEELKASAALMQEASSELQWRARSLLALHNDVRASAAEQEEQTAAMDVDGTSENEYLLTKASANGQKRRNQSPRTSLPVDANQSIGSLFKRGRHSPDQVAPAGNAAHGPLTTSSSARLPNALANLRDLIASSNEMLLTE